MSHSPKRRWYAFRLRTLLLVVLLLAGALTPLAFKFQKARQQRDAVQWVLEMGSELTYDWQAQFKMQQQFGLPGPAPRPPGARWP